MSRRLRNEPEFDVEVKVMEEPTDPLFPRRPNTVSHRRHTLKAIMTVHSVPQGATSLSLKADIVVLDHSILGQEEDVCTPVRLWGSNQMKDIPLDPVDLPQDFTITVEQEGDDHLGQGPYDAYVTVTLGGEGLRDDGAPDARDLCEPGCLPIITGRTFCVRFTSM